MIKKSLVEGLYITIIFYLAVIMANALLGIKLVSEFIFTAQGIIVFYLMVSVGTLMFMRM
jgi:hypothetical protein